jgi:hypothetical protein
MGVLIILHVGPQVAFCAEEDQTFLLNESQIFGSALLEEPVSGSNDVRYVEFPALSTSFPWETVEAEDLDIPKEILDHLSQSTSSDQGGQDQKLGLTRDNLPLDE